jgi:hypothetical protein
MCIVVNHNNNYMYMYNVDIYLSSNCYITLVDNVTYVHYCTFILKKYFFFLQMLAPLLSIVCGRLMRNYTPRRIIRSHVHVQKMYVRT